MESVGCSKMPVTSNKAALRLLTKIICLSYLVDFLQVFPDRFYLVNAFIYPVMWRPDRPILARFEVLTAVLLKRQILRDVTFCCWMSGFRLSERSVWNNLQDWSSLIPLDCFTFEAKNTAILRNTNHTTAQCRIPGDLNGKSGCVVVVIFKPTSVARYYLIGSARSLLVLSKPSGWRDGGSSRNSISRVSLQLGYRTPELPNTEEQYD